MKQERILLLGPTLIAVGGVTTHLNQLLGSDLAKHFELLHFQVGSEGRLETTLQKIIRFAFSPLAFLLFLIQHRPAIVHFNTSFDTKSYWRDVVYLTIAHALKCKILFQKHGGPLPQEFFSGYPLLTSLLRHVLTWADVIVLLGFEEAKAYKQFVPNVRTEVIPNAIDVGTLIADPLSGKQHGPLQLVYLGRLERNKGVFEIMDAFAALVGQGRG